MDLDSALLQPGRELAWESAAHRALRGQVERLYEKMRAAFESGTVARQFPQCLIAPSINARDAFPGSMCLGLTLAPAEDPTSLAFMARQPDDFLLSLKSDGVRYLLLRSVAGGIFLLSRGSQLFELTADEDPRIDCMLDGELVFHSRTGQPCFLLFDSLLFRGQMRFDRNYDERLHDCECFERERAFETSVGAPGLRVFTKDFFRTRDARVLIEQLSHHPLLEGHIDGLILARRNFPYLPGRSPGNLKWKPDELNSIDFLLLENKSFSAEKIALLGPNLSLFEMYVGRGDKLLLFDLAFMDADERERIGSEACIAEMRWDRTFSDEHMKQFIEALGHFDYDVLQALVAGSRRGEALSGDVKAVYTLFGTLDRRMRNSEDRVQGNWRLIRLRPDKQVPNVLSTAEKVLLSMDEQQISSQELLAALTSEETIHKS